MLSVLLDMQNLRHFLEKLLFNAVKHFFICKVIKDCAETGAKILICCDDAYFGLNYEENIETQSLFAYLADIHENVLAVKIDGPTKEDYVWGLRCGFLTFGCTTRN